MRRTAYRLLALSNAVLLVASASARTRPHYGDTLRAQTSGVAMSGDSTPEVLVGPVFETLVIVDDTGRWQAGLATTWTNSSNGQHWEFTLRPDVTFHDGTPCDSPSIAASLSKIPNLPWRVRATARGLVIESDTPQPNLPALLSLSRYAIYAAASDGSIVGTGPFKVDKRTGPLFSLKANDDYWGGRPFVDQLEITTSRNVRDQLSDFNLDRADTIEIAPEQVRHAQQDRLRLTISRPAELDAIVITSHKPELRDLRLRQALALSIDRSSIQTVIFQRQGEMAASLLPNWLTGYAFLFDSRQDLARARQLRMEVGQVSSFTIAYDPSDPVERLIAERIALNVHEAGINLQAVPNTSSGADLRIRSLWLPSLDAAAALNGLIEQLNLPPTIANLNPESLYNSERTALQAYSAIPLVFLPRTTAYKDRVHDLNPSPTGADHFDDAWLTQRSRPEVRP